MKLELASNIHSVLTKSGSVRLAFLIANIKKLVALYSPFSVLLFYLSCSGFENTYVANKSQLNFVIVSERRNKHG